MAKAYSVFANDGLLVEPRVILKVVDQSGNLLEDHSTPDGGKQVISAEAVQQLNSILQDAVLQGTGGGAYIGRPMAGKTGTTDDEHDAWFIGYTPDIVAAVWIGDDTSSNAGYTGGTIPASIWRDFMSAAVADRPVTYFQMGSAAQQKIAAAKAAADKEAAAKKKAEEEAKKKSAVDKAKDAVKNAGQKVLRNITGGKVKGEE